MSNVQNTAFTDLNSTVSFGGGGSKKKKPKPKSSSSSSKPSYGASPNSIHGSYKDGGHMYDHGGIKSAIGPATAFVAGAITGGPLGAAAAAVATIGDYISNN
ncbi:MULTISPECIES: hypothetical protein [unclassified Yoonia]|uniref:hypothetical protein n=1 Tax=unclassified Yoonia TaxID=2629118 RepID=UPI002AFF33E8|nr:MULTISPECIES: hypothetical protein [unclassified Yoonia]